MIKKKMSMALAAALVVSGVAVATPAKAAPTSTKATVSYAIPTKTMVETDDKMEFVVESNVKEAVEYRIWVQNLATKEWTELTDGYQKSEVGSHPFQPATVKDLPKGSYKASIWVKRAGVKGENENKNGEYDSYYIKNFKVQEDGYFAKRANLDKLGLKDSYKVGEKVTITGTDQYKLHIYDPSVEPREKGWMMDETFEDAKATTYEFKKPGVYLVDVWGKKADSPNRFDGWVLKVVTVTENNQKGIALETTVEEATFGSLVSAKCEYPGATKFQVVKDGKPVSSAAKLGEKTTVYPKVAKGETVTINLLDEKEATLVSKEVKLGEIASVEAPKEEEVNVTAVAKEATFGSLVKVTSDNKKVAKFQIFDGEKPISSVVAVGEDTTVYPAKKAGEKVTIKLFDANEKLVKVVKDFVLTAAK